MKTLYVASSELDSARSRLSWRQISRFRPGLPQPGYASKVPALVLLARRVLNCDQCVIIAESNVEKAVFDAALKKGTARAKEIFSEESFAVSVSVDPGSSASGPAPRNGDEKADTGARPVLDRRARFPDLPAADQAISPPFELPRPEGGKRVKARPGRVRLPDPPALLQE